MSEWKNILPTQREFTEEELLEYLHGSASDELRFDIERQMAESPFLDDALEGLQKVKNMASLPALQEQFNKQIKSATKTQVKRRHKRKIADQQWLIVAVLGILLLSIAGYLLIHFYSNQ